MRIFTYIQILVGFICVGCNTQTPEEVFTIKGSIDNQSGKTVFVQQFINNTPSNIDSVIVTPNGDFQLEVSLPNTDFYQLYIADDNAMVFIGEVGKSININAKAGKLQSAIITGNEDSELMNNFNQQFNVFLARRDSIGKLVSTGTPQQLVMQQMNELSTNVIAFITNFVEQHYASPAVLNALSKLDPIEHMALYKKAEQALEPKIGQSFYFQGLQKQIASAQLQAEQLKAQQELEAQRDQLLAIGNPAPEIAMENPLGEIKKLSELKGKVVLIDFWASWCKPCRMENPNVVKMYNRYKSKGFEIFSVSLDKNKLAWQNAIQQDNLTWTHVSDLQFWQSAAAQQYGVNSIPFTVLVDQKGNILAKGLRGAQLEQKLKEILG